MAAVETTAGLEDDEDWLYGDEKEKKPDVDKLNKKIADDKKKELDNEAGEESGDDDESQNKAVDDSEAGAGEDEDDDDDDDDVQVTIGDIRTWTGTDTAPRNLFKSGQNYQKGSTISPAKPMVVTKGLDIEAVGTINGTPVYEFDLTSLTTDEMPWRKPGADINDYFNYGFTEETWKNYCEKQKLLRSEAVSGNAIMTSTISRIISSVTPIQQPEKVVPPLVTQSSAISIINSGSNNTNSGNNNIITIGVIGGSTSRRKDDNIEQQIPVAGSFNRAIPVNFNQPPPSLPNTNMPPPGMPVPSPFGAPMPNFESYYPTALAGQGPPTYGGPFPPTYHPPPFADPNPPPAVVTQPHWDPRRGRPHRFHDRDRWDVSRREHEPRERSPPRRDDDYESRSFRDRDRTRDRDWDRDKDRDWNRDRSRDRDRDRSKDRDRDRDRGRERDRERSRSRERDSSRAKDQDRGRETSRTRDRDDKHKSSRRKHRDRDPDDSDTESGRSGSKHKKSKRRKEGKDEELPTAGTGDEKSRD